MTHEMTARLKHRCGDNCARSVYAAFAEELGLTEREAQEMAPLPRSQGGMCGAYLAGTALLERLAPEKVTSFQEAFEQAYGATSCGCWWRPTGGSKRTATTSWGRPRRWWKDC